VVEERMTSKAKVGSTNKHATIRNAGGEKNINTMGPILTI